MKRLATGAVVYLAALALAAPAASQTAPQIEFEKHELPNGLDVILYEDHSIPIVSVNVWYHVGSGNEKPGRSGFAHLFEHMMFQGSEHHQGEYFEPLQKVGGAINGSTNTDRTNYWQNVPSNYLELVLWLEADRMGFLLPALTEEKFENQRSVVKNERRQNYENQPYGKWYPLMVEMLFPADHPYSWPTIGSQRDLDAATLDDVKEFFQQYYTPNNASIAIAGDIDPAEAKRLVEKYFGDIPAGPPVERLGDWSPQLDQPIEQTAQDDVELSRVYYAWHTPGFFKPGDAEFDLLSNILTSGKTSRLHRALVYEQEIAQDVSSFQWSREMGSIFVIQATAREGQSLDELQAALDAELAKLMRVGITQDELAAARTNWQASFVRRLETVGGFGGIADQLNRYNTYLGDPGRFEWDFARYGDATVESVMNYARAHLTPEKRATLKFVPQGELKTIASDVDRTFMPEGGPEPSFTPPVIQEDRLANGLRVLVVEDRQLPLVQTQLVVKSGFAADPADRPGVASLTAELLDEGTESRDALAIAAEEKRLAASLSTNSSFDASEVSLNVLKEQLDAGLALMSDVVLNPTFPAEELERKRRIYLGRIAQEAKQPQTAAIKMFQRVLYGEDHPYGQPFTGTGTPESIRAITRDDLVGFYEGNYRPNNAALIFVGDLSLAEAKRHAERAFGGWERGQVAARPVPEPEPVQGTQIYIVDKPGAAQSVIIAGSLGLKRSAEDYRAFQVMNNAFGGKFSSRLNLNLREDKGYSYGARSLFLATKGTGPFVILAPVQTQSTKESLVEIIKELRDITGPRPITRREVEEARGNMIKGFPQDFQEVDDIADEVADIVQYDLPLNEWQRFVREVQNITPKEATQAARRHLDPDRLLIVVVGDRDVIEPGIRELELGEIEHLAVED